MLSSPAGFTRRGFLRRAGGAAALVLGGPMLSSCGNSTAPAAGAGGGPGPALETPFKHGVASGDPLADRVILWTRATPVAGEDIPVTVSVYRDAALSQLVGSASQTASAARDWTIKIDFAGLQPGTSYYYRFSALGFQSPIGRTRTAPAEGVQRLRFGVVSCSSYAHGYFNAYAQVAKRADLDVILHLGDYVYEYGNGEYGDLRPYEPATEMLTLADYRTRHSYYKRTDPDLQEVHRQHPFICVWDDHETADNSWRDGANNHTEGAEGAWVDRKAYGQQVYDEWMPIRLPEPGNPDRIYRKFSYGGLMDLIMLDTRLHDRDEPLGLPPLPPDDVADPDRKLLGPEQQQWLLDSLSSSTATWKFLGQQVMFGQLKVVGLPDLSTQVPQLSLIPIAGSGGQYLNGDQWDGYQAERSAIFNHLAEQAIDNVVVLTGDIHTSWTMDLTPDPNNPVAYNPLTGAGSLAVEYVCTSVTSPGLEQLAPVQDAISLVNPHIKYVDLQQKGYMVFDVTPEQVLGEHWYVSTITERGGTESFATAFPVAVGSNRLGAASGASTPPANSPALAP
ncbi:MAG: alkaline phosphatase D family protein [Stagnimonas sp.]|nr:alkaline phosphatase D family protein [Stagnimonas sp.]